ncbi:MAG TPA: alcohol dehydrogenase catalytic domain-containing protein, partial [Thermodesulfobacteriota bacterium]
GPGVLQLETVAPPSPRDAEVLVRVDACGVCFHDVLARRGLLRRRVRMPLVPGHEVAGVVEAVGPAVRRLKPGDRVASTQRRRVCGRCRYCRCGREASCPEREGLGDAGLNGGYAELVCIDEATLALVPDGIPPEQAAIAGCAIGTALHAVRDAGGVRPGHAVLVTGASGGIGIHAVQLARLAGGFVVAVTTSPRKAQRIGELGAHEVLVARPGEDFSAAVRELTGGAGVDVAIDTVGSPLFHPTRRSLAPGGRWVLAGQLTDEPVPFNPAQLLLRDLSIASAWGAARTQLEDALRLVRLGQVTPVVASPVPLEEAAAAHERLERAEATGRLVLSPLA